MSNPTTNNIVHAYFSAWTRGDVDKAGEYLHDELDFLGSIDEFQSKEELLGALRKFSAILQSVELLRSFVDGNEAMLMYDCVTTSPAGTIRTVEYLKVVDGKIKELRVVFDATELRKLMESGPQSS